MSLIIISKKLVSETMSGKELLDLLEKLASHDLDSKKILLNVIDGRQTNV